MGGICVSPSVLLSAGSVNSPLQRLMLSVKGNNGEIFCCYPLHSFQMYPFFLFLFLLRSLIILEAEIKNIFMAKASAHILFRKTCNLSGAELGGCRDSLHSKKSRNLNIDGTMEVC